MYTIDCPTIFSILWSSCLRQNNFGFNLNDFDTGVFVIITFTLQFAAIMSEVIRSAYLSLLIKDNLKPAVSVGLSPFQAYRRIIFPQAFVVAFLTLEMA